MAQIDTVSVTEWSTGTYPETAFAERSFAATWSYSRQTVQLKYFTSTRKSFFVQVIASELLVTRSESSKLREAALTEWALPLGVPTSCGGCHAYFNLQTAN